MWFMCGSFQFLLYVGKHSVLFFASVPTQCCFFLMLRKIQSCKTQTFICFSYFQTIFSLYFWLNFFSLKIHLFMALFSLPSRGRLVFFTKLLILLSLVTLAPKCPYLLNSLFSAATSWDFSFHPYLWFVALACSGAGNAGNPGLHLWLCFGGIKVCCVTKLHVHHIVMFITCANSCCLLKTQS